MQIRRKLKINAVVSAITAFIILLILFVALYHLNNANESGKIAGEIIADSFERVSLSNDYILNNNKRAKEQWFAKHEELGRLLKSAFEKFKKSEDIKILAGMLKDHESIGKVFAAIMENREKARSNAYSANLSGEIENRLISQLNMRGYEFVINGRHLLESSREARVSAFRVTGAGIVFVFVILTATTLINSLMMGRTITDRIQRLRAGALIIGAGNLDHRIDVKGDDEFAELSDAFNTMTTKLRGSYHDLEGEISERKQAEEALRESEARLDLALRSAHMGVWHWDIRENRRYFDDQVCHLLGMDPESFTGAAEEFFGVVFPEDRENIMSALNQTIDQDVLYEPEYRVIWPDGSIRYITARGKLVRDDNRQPVRINGICWDITERKQAEEEIIRLNVDLHERNDKLELANKELESFIYSVSHDLRAPLRHISGFANLVMKNSADKLDEKGKQYFSRIHDGAEKMSRLIDDMLNLSRISRQDIQRREVNVSAIAASIVNELRETHPGRSVEVDIKEGLTVFADPGLIEVVLSNLLENAWKFTGRTEHARIEFGTVEQDGKIIYYVRDNGAGFDQKYAGKMFWPFHRLHSEAEFEGTGIGLAIVDRIIRRHGGKVWAEGIDGKGATIYFSLT